MIKTTLKEIREFDAEDITYAKNGNQLYKDLTPFKIILYSAGVYGNTGIVIFSKVTNKYYKITSKSNNLTIFN